MANDTTQVDQTTQNSEGQQTTQTTVTETNTASNTENLIPQADVNNIVARESKKAQEKILKDLGLTDFDSAKDGLDKFRAWQEEQKSEAEKQQEELNNLTESNKGLLSENNTLKAQLSAIKQGVNSDYVEDVVVLAERLVNDETDLDAAIKSVLEKHPHFSGAQQQPQQVDRPTFINGQRTQQEGAVNAFDAIKNKYKK